MSSFVLLYIQYLSEEHNILEKILGGYGCFSIDLFLIVALTGYNLIRATVI